MKPARPYIWRLIILVFVLTSSVRPLWCGRVSATVAAWLSRSRPRVKPGLTRRQARGGRAGAADQNTAEAVVGKHLLPHEREVIIVRRHPAVLIGPSVLTLAWPVAAGLLTVTALRGNEPLVTLVWIAWLALVVRMIWKAANWIRTFFVVTPQRMLLVSGVLARKVEMLPLVKVTDMSFRRSFTGRLLGFGEFIIESAGSNQPLQTIVHIPYPEQLYLEVCGLIFRDPGNADD